MKGFKESTRGVSVYRNQAGAYFIFVCEAEGNAITVLVTNYVQHDELIFVWAPRI